MTLLNQQEAQVEELRGALMQMIQMELVNHKTSVNTRDWIQRGRLCLRKTSIAEFIQNSHVFCMEQYDDILSLADQEQVVNVVGAMMLHLVEGLGNIVTVRDRTSEASDDFVPPVLPHELVVLPSREMSKMIIKQKARLMSSAAYRNDNAVKASIDQCNSDMPFNAAWSMATIAGRYSALVEFIGGLASIFPNTSVIESDLSILKYEKDSYHASMTNFTLQSILHCKQLATIIAIPT